MSGNKERILIFDTTLRDGEQSPGASMNIQEKLDVAQQLAQLGVDIIEAGFPISSPGDFEAVKLIAQRVEGPQICGLARARDADIDRCWEAVRHSARPRIHTFVATSDVHMEKKLRKPPEEVLQIAVNAVRRARNYTDNVEFSPEDAARTGRDFLCRIVEAAIRAGATTVNIPDTVGYSNPWEFGELIRMLFDRVPNIDQAVLSVHCHNDLGLAVANSLAAVLAGARQIECTINGIGERAGNCSLEEVVMNIHTRQDCFPFTTGIQTRQLYKLSRLVSTITGLSVQPNKAIVGRNAFAHEAGIHQDGMLKDRVTYEIMNPEDVGWTGESLVMGKHSGRNAFRDRLRLLGYELDGEAFERAFSEFKRLADLKKDIYDEDLHAIAGEVLERERRTQRARYELVRYHVTSGSDTPPQATVVLRIDGQETEPFTCSGDGPINASYEAIRTLCGTEGRLVSYQIQAVTSGSDAQGEVVVRFREGVVDASGRGRSTDVIEASILALLSALNNLELRKQKVVPATGEAIV